MIMNKETLLQDFLNKFPNAVHPLDEERFLRYAIACAEDDVYIDTEAMKNAGVNLKRIEQLENAYSWIRGTYKFMKKERMLFN